uniref:Cadherin domain-containing protein n=1 Tax=Macrostomum lignano TaxID=282301 RepID=A0A1I8HQ89_9PLAT
LGKMPPPQLRAWRLLTVLAALAASAAAAGSPIVFQLDEDDGRMPPPPTSAEQQRRQLRQIGRLDVGQASSSASPIRFTLLRAPGDTLAGQFDVDSDRGAVSYRGARIDRDSLCATTGACCDSSRQVCVIQLRVRAINPSAPDSSRSLLVEIHLRDVNDNAPSFPRPELQLTLDENGHQGEEIALPASTDADAGENGIESYELVGDTAGHFQLRTSGGGGRPEPRLLVTKPLDREETPELRLTLVARDGGDPRLSGQLRIRVRVNDKNDETPRFHLDGLRPPLTVRLSETHPAGADQPFLLLNATDSDAGLNSRLRYRLRDSQQRAQSLFFINPSQPRQPAGLRAGAGAHSGRRGCRSDGGFASGGVASRTGSVTLTISVLDVNDEAPVIVLTSLSSDGQLSVDENKPPDTLVAWLTVSDADSSGVRGVDCRLGDDKRDSGGSGGGFRLLAKSSTVGLDQQEFELRTARQLDAETSPKVNLTIVCTDRGKPPLSSRRSIRVIVNNLNDNAPTFQVPGAGGQPPLRLSVPENRRPGWLVCGLNATDADGDAIRFELLEFGRAPFRLDERTGRLYATESFDRELVDEYHLRDVNDNPPSFPPGTVYEFTVSESAEPGQPLGVLRADDPDAGENGRVQYSLAEFAARRRFRLDPDTGQLSTAREAGQGGGRTEAQLHV